MWPTRQWPNSPCRSPVTCSHARGKYEAHGGGGRSSEACASRSPDLHLTSSSASLRFRDPRRGGERRMPAMACGARAGAALGPCPCSARAAARAPPPSPSHGLHHRLTRELLRLRQAHGARVAHLPGALELGICLSVWCLLLYLCVLFRNCFPYDRIRRFPSRWPSFFYLELIPLFNCDEDRLQFSVSPGIWI